MKLAGVDLNGWRDFAIQEIDAEEASASETFRLIDGGVQSVAVKLKLDQEEWIGGPQASIAPHGRGNGWGDIGAAGQRRRLSSILSELHADDDDEERNALRACVDALGRHAKQVIVTIDDLETADESVRSRILAAAQKRGRRVTLLWRSVALFLAAFQDRRVTPDDLDEEIILVDHTSSGLAVQALRLRADSEHRGHYAPERQGYGALCARQFGLAKLESVADGAVLKKNPHFEPAFSEPHELGGALLCGNIHPGSTHIRRRDNGAWTKLEAPGLAPDALFGSGDLADLNQWLGATGHARKAFLSSPLRDELRSHLLERLKGVLPRLELLAPSAAASGAYLAGEYIRRGRPHYFDRLTPIALAILRDDEPIFDPLIDSETTLPANKEYVSPVYDRLEWAKGKNQIEFYVRKGDKEVRHWQVSLDQPPPRTVRVTLQLRQTPGQSWATLALSSREWEPLQRTPIKLNWRDLRPDERDPEQILKDLEAPPPLVPARVVEPSHDALWESGGMFKIGFAEYLDSLGDATPAPKQLHELLSRRANLPVADLNDIRRCWTVGTDGHFPAAAQARHREKLNAILDAYSARLVNQVAACVPFRDNDLLRALTWSFTLCPRPTQELMVDALEIYLKDKKGHPLLGPTASDTVLIQGAGRCVTDIELLRRVVDFLTRAQPSNNTLSALCMILTRRASISQVLTDELVASICKIVLSELNKLADAASFDVKFKNAITALSGLFRYREAKRYALLIDHDPFANEIRDSLMLVREKLGSQRRAILLFDLKMKIIENVITWLEGNGSADILVLVDQI